MTGRIAFAVFVATSIVLHGCAGLSDRPDEITGNNTGGVIPPKMAAKGNVEGMAAAHCAKWGSTARVTFTQAQTGGEAVFVCEKGGQPAMNPAASAQPQPAGPSVIPAPRR
jgi:hypothetical protein